MDTPTTIEAPAGTVFTINGDGTTTITRSDQPECTIPTEDMLAFDQDQ